MNARRRVKNVNDLLKKALEEKDFYNALQYYKTIISKYPFADFCTSEDYPILSLEKSTVKSTKLRSNSI